MHVHACMYFDFLETAWNIFSAHIINKNDNNTLIYNTLTAALKYIHAYMIYHA